MVKTLTTADFNEAKEAKVAVVDFFAQWCGPCKMLSPVFHKIADDNEGKALFCSVDVDNSEEIAQEFGVKSIPTLVVLKDGKEVAKKVGFESKSDVIDFITSNL